MSENVVVVAHRCVDCDREVLAPGICPACRERTGRQLELFAGAA